MAARRWQLSARRFRTIDPPLPFGWLVGERAIMFLPRDDG